MKTFNTIGKPRRRVDGRAKVTGQTRFADDIMLPRMLHCRLLRSTAPHARITRLDVSRAQAHPGVHLVLTGETFPIAYGILPVSQDEHALCPDKVRFVGDPVAAVIAQDEATAADALELIEVEYEPLRTYATPEDSLAYPEPRIHDYGDEGNIHKAVALQFGDVDAAINGADHVFEDLFFFEGNTHLPIEQHATVATKDADGKLVVWSSTQTPHYLHRALAKALAMPAAHIRVIATPNGGGFGGKSDPFNHEVVVAKAALLLDRPVKICLTREEVFYCHRGRHPVLMQFRTGVTKEGKITGLDLETLLDGGAYGSYGVASTFYTGALQTVTYDIPRYRFRGCRVFTNKPPCGPKRGHGTPQRRFGQEVQLDKIAERLAIDPADLRLNMVAPADSLTANFLQVGTIGLAECIRSVVARSDWKEMHGKLPHGRGFGLACSSYLSGAGLPINWNDLPHSGVQLKLDRSGGVTVFCGATEIGQGSDDVLVGCVAEVLGIDPFDIRAVTGDTDLTPVDLGSYSSRVTLMMGNAAIQAAERARDLLAEAVSAKLDIPRERLVFAERRVFDGEDPAVGMTFQEAVCLAEAKFGTLGTTGSYTPPKSPAKFKGGGVGPSPTYSYTAAVVEVEVDPETGWLTVPRVWIAHDIGRALNPDARARAGRRRRLHGARRGADGGAGVPPAAGAALARARAQVPVDPRIQEPDVARHAGDLHRADRASRSAGPVRRKGSGPGSAAPDHARRGQRGVRRRRRAHGRDPRDAGEDPQGAAAQGCRPARALRPDGISHGALARDDARGAAMGGRRWPRLQRTRAQEAQGRGRRRGDCEGERMMRLPSFRYLAPASVAEAAKWLADAPATTMLVAGGTDLLPNMKRRQQTPKTVIGLRGIEELQRLDSLRLGAGVTLTSIVRDGALRRAVPGLWQAAAQVATPHLRNMGTIGGNLCLDTRCTYYDQSAEWRKAIGYCMKKDGDTCWVATSSPKCLAVSSTDTAPMLQALGARVTLVSDGGTREIGVEDLYQNDGMHYLLRRPDEILTEVIVPDQGGWTSTYWKLRRRGSFDFPVAAVAAAATFDGPLVTDARIVLGAVLSRPASAPKAVAAIVGQALTDDVIAAAADAAYEIAKPMDNTDFELVWRKKMVRTLVTCALREMRGDDMRETRMRLAKQTLA